MKSIIPIHRIGILIAIASIALLPSARAGFTNIHDFDVGRVEQALGIETNLNGYASESTLVISGNTLFGTTAGGGAGGSGTVFSIHTDGSSYSNLYTFTVTSSNGSQYTNVDGSLPQSGLLLSGGTLYGTTSAGGFGGLGNVFAINTDGTGMTNLYNFLSYSTGISPYASLIISGSTLYGVTEQGGSGGEGTLFALNIDGTGYTNIYNFNGSTSGANPYGNLVLSGGVFYGTTESGVLGGGTVFRVNTDGTGYTNLIKFSGNDIRGNSPSGGLVLSGNTLYGTTQSGGTNSPQRGTVFAINTDGTGFQSLHSFNFSDGSQPYDTLTLSGGILYGTTSEGGLHSEGTLFAISTNGASFTNLYSLSQFGYNSQNMSTNSDGANPRAGLLLSGNTLYGVASYSGNLGGGSVFALSLVGAPAPVPLNIQLSGYQAILSWTDATFSLYAAPTVNGTFTKISGAASPFTNALTGTSQFFRLQAN